MTIPAANGPFVGRAQELAEVVELLRTPCVRLVTLVGLGGIGKSRLVLEAASRAEAEFPDGAVFVSLAPLRDPNLLADVIAQALGIEESDGQSREQALLAFVAEREILLVLDNFEQIWAGRHLVSQLIATAPEGFAVIVTSQRPLDIRGERVFPIPEMTTPTAGRDHTADLVLASDAVQLFQTYGIAANPSFRVTDANAEAVAEICRKLEGIPLALELAAARVRSTDPMRLLQLLSPRLGFLDRGAGDQPERLQTMENAIGWSYGLLDPSLQRLLRCLAVFAGGCTAEGAARVALAGPAPERTNHAFVGQSADQRLHAELDDLVTVSLLRFELSQNGGGRYRMLGAVREFAFGRLNQSDETESTHWAFVAAMLEFVEALKPELRGEQAARAIRQLEDEHENVLAALRWAIAQGAAGGESALRICTAIWSFWKQRGHLTEAEYWLRQALAAAGDDVTPHHGNGYLLLGHTVADQRTGWMFYERALETYQRLGSPPRYVAGTMMSLGQTAIQQGDYPRAKALLVEAQRLLEADSTSGSPSDLAHVHLQLGTLASRTGDADAAIFHLDRARELWEEENQTVDVVNAIVELGRVYGMTGQFAIANDLLNWALSKARAINDIDAEGRALCEIGIVECARGDDASGLTHLRGALQLYLDTFYPFAYLAIVIETIAMVCSRHGEDELAAMLVGFAGNWRRKTGSALHPSEQVVLARLVEQLKRRLGAANYDVAASRGQRLIQLNEVVNRVVEIRLSPQTKPSLPGLQRKKPLLTPREHEVLCLLVTGLKYREIASAIGVEESTVKKFVERIYDALDVNNRTAATGFAFQHELCP